MESHKASSIRLGDFHSIPMRAFHMSWFAFFLCFFAWFGIAPLMAVVREDLGLTKAQIGNTIIASVAITILVRIAIGPLVDRFGPRRTYSTLLMLGSLPVMGIGLADSYETFLLFRLAIGAIGASFVITQYHTSTMFASNCVGTANATSAGWGNLGGGVTQMVMPMIFAGIMMFGVSSSLGWRLAMVVPGVVLFACGIAYFVLTKDSPLGDFKDLPSRRSGHTAPLSAWQSIRFALSDSRIWILFVAYSACFGVELTINNIAALYFHDRFSLSVESAGLIAGLFGLMNIFARTLGGFASDRVAMSRGLRGRVSTLFACLLCQGIALIIFSQMGTLPYAIGAMITFSVFVQMSEGATFGIVPFVNRRALGLVAGIVGAGGNAGAVMAGFLFRSESLSTAQGLLYLGIAVCFAACLTPMIRFSQETEQEEQLHLQTALASRLDSPQAEPAISTGN